MYTQHKCMFIQETSIPTQISTIQPAMQVKLVSS